MKSSGGLRASDEHRQGLMGLWVVTGFCCLLSLALIVPAGPKKTFEASENLQHCWVKQTRVERIFVNDRAPRLLMCGLV